MNPNKQRRRRPRDVQQATKAPEKEENEDEEDSQSSHSSHPSVPDSNEEPTVDDDDNDTEDDTDDHSDETGDEPEEMDNIENKTENGQKDETDLTASPNTINTPGPTTSTTPSLLSKAWSLETAHQSLFTGGPVTHSHTHSGSGSNSKKTGSNTSSSHQRPFLLLPVHGNLVQVDTATSRPMAWVRERTTLNSDDDEDDDTGWDADAITAYALSWNDQVLVTCSNNLILKQYAVRAATVPTEEGTTTTTAAAATTATRDTATTPPLSRSMELMRSWGRSGHFLPVTLMQFHRSNVFVATGSMDGSVRIWDVRSSSAPKNSGTAGSGFCTHVFAPLEVSSSTTGGANVGGSGHRAVTALQWFHGDAAQQPQQQSQLIIAIGRDDGSIAIHNLRQPNSALHPVAMLADDHVSTVTCLSWTHNGQIFLSAGRDAVLNVWSVEPTDEDKPGEKKKKPKNKRTLTTSHADVLALPNYRYTRLQTLPIYEQVEGMVVLPRTETRRFLAVATAGSKGRVRLWKLDSSTGPGEPDGAETVDLHRKRLAAFHLELLEEQPLVESFGEERGGYLGLCFCPGQSLVSISSVDDKSSSIKTESHLIVADAEHNLSFLSLNDQSLLSTRRTFVGHNDDILDLKVLPPSPASQSPQIVVATNSAKVRIFDLQDFSCHVLDGHKAIVLCVDVSPCGRLVATCGKDKQVRLWTVAERRACVALATGHTEAVGSVALSRKTGRYGVTGKAAKNGGGAFCVSASSDRTIKRWNLPGMAILEKAAQESEEIALKAFESVRAHEKDINTVAVAPNDSLIATGSQDKTVKLWKSTDLSLQATLKGHKRGVWDCQFSPFDRVLATASGDKTIKIWSLSDYSCVRFVRLYWFEMKAGKRLTHFWIFTGRFRVMLRVFCAFAFFAEVCS